MQKKHWAEQQGSHEYPCWGNNQGTSRFRLGQCLCQRHRRAPAEQGLPAGLSGLAWTPRGFINAAHVKQTGIKSGLLKAPSQLHPILSLIYLPRVMLSAQDSHPDSYPSRGNIANANSCFLLTRSRAVSEQPHTRDVKP